MCCRVSPASAFVNAHITSSASFADKKSLVPGTKDL